MSQALDVIDTAIAGTLDGLFLERVRRSPGEVAYRQFNRASEEWETSSWQDMALLVGRWQAALQGERLSPGDRVALQLRNCREWVAFDMAAHASGLVVVPLYTDDRPDNVNYILEDAGVRLLLIQDAGRWRRLKPELPDNSALQRVLLLDGEADADDDRVRRIEDWLPPSASSPIPCQPDPMALASIVYTSGTTGRSKGVMLSHFNMLSIANAGLKAVDVFPQDEFLSFLPLSHTLERTGGYYLPMMAGASVAYARSVNQLAQDLGHIRPTVLIAVPRIFERVYGRIQKQLASKSSLQRRLFNLAVATGWYRFEVQQGRKLWSPHVLLWPLFEKLVARKITAALGGRLRLAVSGGAPLSPDVARLFLGLGLPLLQGYGLTETSPVIACNRPEMNDPASVGPLLPGVGAYIGKDDELIVFTPGVMKGYWNNDLATLQMIDAKGWLHTGDQARIENNFVYITGRIKDILVLSNGEKVPPAEMEQAIALDPLVEQVMVVGEGRPNLTALLVLDAEAWDAEKPGQPPDDANARQFLLKRIREALAAFPGYARVRAVHVCDVPWTVENGMMTPTLKVRRSLVLEHYADEVEQLYKNT